MEHPYAHILRAIADGEIIQVKLEDAWMTKRPDEILHMIAEGSYEQTGIRIKPRTIEINGAVVPEPLRVEPKSGQVVFVVDLAADNCAFGFKWSDTPSKCNLLQRGIIHATKEACREHAHALIRITANKPE